MLVVKSVKPRPLIDEICKSWREEIQFEKSHYKINLTHFNNRFKFELTFATWHSIVSYWKNNNKHNIEKHYCQQWP